MRALASYIENVGRIKLIIRLIKAEGVTCSAERYDAQFNRGTAVRIDWHWNEYDVDYMGALMLSLFNQEPDTTSEYDKKRYTLWESVSWDSYRNKFGRDGGYTMYEEDYTSEEWGDLLNSLEPYITNHRGTLLDVIKCARKREQAKKEIEDKMKLLKSNERNFIMASNALSEMTELVAREDHKVLTRALGASPRTQDETELAELKKRLNLIKSYTKGAADVVMAYEEIYATLNLWEKTVFKKS